jgi:hypothetical protein
MASQAVPIVKAAFFAAMGVHAVLLGVPASMHIFCLARIIAGVAAIIGACLSLAMPPRNLRIAFLTFFIGLTLAGGGTFFLHQTPPRASTATHFRSADGGARTAGRDRLRSAGDLRT